MADSKNSTQSAYKKMVAEIETGNFAPVYLLIGEESYYIDKVCDLIMAKALKEEERDFNQTVMYGADSAAMQVINQARRFPMMAERQVVVVREAQAMKDVDKLEKYVDILVPTTILVVCYKYKESEDAKKAAPTKLRSRFATRGRVLECNPPKYESEIVAFINSYLKDEQKATIDSRAAQVVAAHIGGDLKRLASELDKVLITFGPNEQKIITPDLVEQKIGISKRYNIFELQDAIIDRHAEKAFTIAKYMMKSKNARLEKILPSLFGFFQNLMLAYYTPRPATDSAIMAQIGDSRKFIFEKYKRAMKNYSAKKTLDIISKLREMDVKSKGVDNVSASQEDLLKELLAYILY